MADHLTDGWLYQYIDGELEHGRHHAQIAHLQQCAECQQRLREAESLFAAIESIPDIQLESSLAPAVVVRVRALSGRSRRLWRVAAVQAALALLAVGLIASEAATAVSGLAEQIAAQVALDPALSVIGWWTDIQQQVGALSSELQSSLDQLTQLPALAGGEVPWLLVVIAGAGLWLLVNGLWIRRDTTRAWPSIGPGGARHGG